MTLKGSLVSYFAAAALLCGAGALAVSGAGHIATSQGTRISDTDYVHPVTTDGRVLQEVFYDCATVRDYERRAAVTTCKIDYR